MKKKAILTVAFLIVLALGFAATASAQTSDNSEQANPVFIFELEEIAKVTKHVDRYTPEGNTYWLNFQEGEWLLRAVSLRAREEWIKDRWKTTTARKKVAEVLDVLAVAGAKKLPTYKSDPKEYPFHNLAEEKMMKGAFENLAALKIHKIGLGQTNWLISKNEFGLPTKRYKQGMIWARKATDDHPYCHFYYVNILQDYAGGGTYGASYAIFAGEELAGCP